MPPTCNLHKHTRSSSQVSQPSSNENNAYQEIIRKNRDNGVTLDDQPSIIILSEEPPMDSKIRELLDIVSDVVPTKDNTFVKEQEQEKEQEKEQEQEKEKE